ncbi:homocysteine-responsive endoplasmic reticulum-resident ubiquitin-like domain member 1 protein [Polyodon spathula]|uniref:homocysteine-responsive endoplasmic reticulum-resident ubiquitin-like domain member 1 protein n=1 Tax=Polyodon spathula TaxID=7913 RepID=UPI001B7F1831|nr:homocysteine-responsive endoplasmic reticulum-resident ubiquitin-like domain member 1 protein [Polyodon spathula]
MELPPNPVEPEQEALTLTIKTPNQAFEDQTVRGVLLTWTVKELKTHLTRIYPSHPPEKDQRLIYSGKLLPDHLHMKDIFRKSDTQPTLHLVCSFKPPLDLHQPTQAKLTERNPRVDSAPRTPSQAVGAVSPSAAGDGLRHRGNLQDGAAAWTPPVLHTGGDQQSHPGLAAYSMYNPQQLLWLQQMYARQYYMHYQAALAAAAAASPPAPSPQSLPVVPPGAPALADQAPVNQNIAPPAPVNPGANQNLRMNAQGGPVMEEEEELNRDWLDWLYTASRFSVFLSILYFYSSVSRFVMVMSALMVLYLYTAGWFPFRQRPARPVPNNPVLAQAAEDIQNQENQNRNDAPEDVSGEEQGQTEALLAATLPERRSVFNTAWIFFKTFFSSLIPEGPQAIAN